MVVEEPGSYAVRESCRVQGTQDVERGRVKDLI